MTKHDIQPIEPRRVAEVAPRKRVLTIRCESDLFEALRIEAHDRRVSVNFLCQVLLRQGLMQPEQGPEESADWQVTETVP